MYPQRRVNTDDLRVRLAVGQTRIAVEGIAADARGMRQRLAIFFFEQNADRKMKRMMPLSLQSIE
jgi:hypothetical protein